MELMILLPRQVGSKNLKGGEFEARSTTHIFFSLIDVDLLCCTERLALLVLRNKLCTCRHPELTTRVAQSLERTRAGGMNKKTISAYFKLIEEGKLGVRKKKPASVAEIQLNI